MSDSQSTSVRKLSFGCDTNLRWRTNKITSDLDNLPDLKQTDKLEHIGRKC